MIFALYQTLIGHMHDLRTKTSCFNMLAVTLRQGHEVYQMHCRWPQQRTEQTWRLKMY